MDHFYLLLLVVILLSLDFSFADNHIMMSANNDNNWVRPSLGEKQEKLYKIEKFLFLRKIFQREKRQFFLSLR